MKAISTLLTDLKRLLNDDRGLFWTEEELLVELREAHKEYLRRVRGYRVFKEIEPVNYDLEFKVDDGTVRIEYAHNSRNIKVDPVSYKTMSEDYAGDLEDARPDVPQDYYGNPECKKLKTYPPPKGTLDIYDDPDVWGTELNIENFEVSFDPSNVWGGIAGDGVGVILQFSEWTGEKLHVNLSIMPEGDYLRIRFFESLIWRAASQLMKKRKETESEQKSQIYEEVFNKYIADDIRLRKRQIGTKAHGGHF